MKQSEICEGTWSLLTVEQAQDAGPFTVPEPDNFTAYMGFKAAHSLPVVLGPLNRTGNFMGFHPQVLANSYRSLMHKQINLRHQIKSYSPKDITRDRIVGAVVGVHYAPPHLQIPKEKGSAVPIHGMAAIFKQAEGVPKMLGEHLSGREPQNVSIENIFDIADAGIYVPSTGEIVPVGEAIRGPLRSAIEQTATGKLRVKKYKGEQLVIVPGGTGGRVEMQGAGITPTPAEKEAEITQMLAEAQVTEKDGMMMLAAESVTATLFARGVRFRDALGGLVTGKLLKVHTTGTVKAAGWTRTVDPLDPLLEIRTSAAVVLRRLSSVCGPA